MHLIHMHLIPMHLILCTYTYALDLILYYPTYIRPMTYIRLYLCSDASVGNATLTMDWCGRARERVVK